MKLLLALAIVLTLSVPALSANWAVLIAGSNGFWNYRHQADVCHAYKMLIQNGYLAENIITFSYDDVANNQNNPFIGTLFNKPTGDLPGKDVYEGCIIDYKGADVTPQNFLAALKGDSAAANGKKVLQSTVEDRVFINFADHGAPGLIAFPSEYLYAKDLHTTFKFMFEHGMYKSLVFYLESCESGSMFEDLRVDIGIYGVSAANPTESSWGYYCPPDDMVGGKSIGSCLGDLFSINWLEDSDKGDLSRSLKQQFETVRDLTKQSEVMQWGDLTYLDEPISNYLSWNSTSPAQGFLSKFKQYLFSEERRELTSWDSRDNKLLYLINRFKNTQAEEDLIALQNEYYERQYFDQKFTQLKSTVRLTGQYSKSVDNACLEKQINHFENTCTKLTDYGLKYVKYLAEMCDTSNLLTAQMQEHISTICD